MTKKGFLKPLLPVFFLTGSLSAEPYELPLLEDSQAIEKPILPAPEVDFQKVFNLASNCSPTKSIWDNVDIKLQGNYREIQQTSTDDFGRYYIGIVAEMPLFTGAEITRQRTEEEKRRQDIAKDISDYKDAVANYRLAQRMLGLYASLETRAKERIKAGITPTKEQVTYLEKTADAWRDKITHKSTIEKLRLALTSRCVSGTKKTNLAQLLDSYIKDSL